MAEAIFNDLADEKGLEARAGSAGVAALEGRPMAPEVRDVLREIGVSVNEAHRALQADEAALDGADLVLTMEPWHIAEVRRKFGDAPPFEMHTLPDYVGASGEGGVPDPYGRTANAYRAAAYQIFEYVDLLIKRLQA